MIITRIDGLNEIYLLDEWKSSAHRQIHRRRPVRRAIAGLPTA